MVPPWANDYKSSRHTYNAKSETASEKLSYRAPLRQRQFGLVMVDDFYEPNYESGKAVRWKIELATCDPFGMACLWDRWTDPATGDLIVSFSMLIVNADECPVMCQFHRAGDEKRTAVNIAPELHDSWLSADQEQAAKLMNWLHMPALKAAPALRSISQDGTESRQSAYAEIT